jgi:hypothetical protein
MKTKECPSCAMDVDAKSKSCPICGYEFPGFSKAIKLTAVLLVLVFLYFLIRSIL